MPHNEEDELFGPEVPDQARANIPTEDTDGSIRSALVSDTELEAEMERLKTRYEACMATNTGAYRWTVASVVASVPLSIAVKRMSPLFVLGVLGMGGDFYDQWKYCDVERQDLEKVMLELKRRQIDAERELLRLQYDMLKQKNERGPF